MTTKKYLIAKPADAFSQVPMQPLRDRIWRTDGQSNYNEVEESFDVTSKHADEVRKTLSRIKPGDGLLVDVPPGGDERALVAKALEDRMNLSLIHISEPTRPY